MSELRPLRNFWILWVTTIVLACFSNAVAQESYKVTDLGVLPNHNLGCAMGLNNRGWTEIMEGNLAAGTENSTSGILLNGRVGMNIDGINFDLGTLGGKNSWTNYGGINEQGEAVGYSETAVSDPNGEDVCLFGTGLTCHAFLWRNGRMYGLAPLEGGNNSQASAINNNGETAGYSENGLLDSTCPTTVRNNRIDLPVLWEKDTVRLLSTVGTDPDGVAYGINNQGQATGYSGTCTSANHAVRWEKDGTATPLDDFGVPGDSFGFGINDHGEIVGVAFGADGVQYATIWQGKAITNLGTLPGDVAYLGEGINNQGQAVGSTIDSAGNWSHAFLWQNGVMIDINTLFPASSNLYATMANQINDSGQISGMAVVQTGPHATEVHAFVATPVNASVGQSVADVASTLPKVSLPANVGNQLLRRSGLGQFGR